MKKTNQPYLPIITRAAMLLSLGFSPTWCFAGEVSTDGSLGPAATTLLKDAAETFTIEETLGQRSGRNLFHSFQTFNIDASEIAQFTEITAGSTDHVISRVTGGVSSIAGTINNIPDASFWFVNTAGVIIEPGAEFNVTGALALGSVDYVEFADGTRFHALPNAADDVSSLTINPVSFGFLDTSTAGTLAITSLNIEADANVGDILLSGGTLSIADSSITNVAESTTLISPIEPLGGAILVFGGDTTIDDTDLVTQGVSGANAADIEIASTGDIFIRNNSLVRSTPADQVSNPGHAGAVTVATTNSLTITDSTLDVSTTPTSFVGALANAITLTADSLDMQRSALLAFADGDADAPGAVLIGAAGDINISDQTLIRAGTLESNNNPLGGAISIASNGGDVTVTDSLATISRGGIIVVPGDPQASQIIIQGLDTTPAPTLIRNRLQVAAAGTITGANANFSSVTLADPDAGDITLAATAISLTDGFVRTSSIGAGDAGNIVIAGPGRAQGTAITATDNMANSINLAGSLEISSTGTGQELPTFDGGVYNVTPNAGSIEISSSGALTMVGQSPTDQVSISSASINNAGLAGSLLIQGDAIDAQFAALSTAIDTNVIGGTAATIDLLFNGDVSLQDTTISASTSGGVDAGSILLTGSEYSFNQSQITSSTVAAGNAGDVLIAGPGSTRTALLATGAVSLTNGSDIVVSSTDNGLSPSSYGGAGNINVLATGDVTIQGGIDAAEVSSASLASGGPAGTVSITGNNLTAANALISTETSSDVDSPTDIALLFDGALNLTATDIRAATTAVADAGDIVVEAAQIDISGGSINAITTGLGNAGDVTLAGPGNKDTAAIVTTNSVTLQQGADIKVSAGSASSPSNAGTAGDISIFSAGPITLAGLNDLDPAEISSASFQGAGAAGEINLTGTNFDASFAAISTETAADSGTVATISLEFSDSVTLASSQVNAATQGAVDAGTISVEGTSVAISGGRLSSATTGLGNGGNIFIGGPGDGNSIGGVATGDINLTQGAVLSVSANNTNNAAGLGNAGAIRLTSDGQVSLVGSPDSPVILSSSADAPAIQAGTLSINSRGLTVSEAELTTEVAGNNGAVAQIELTVSEGLNFTDSIVSASTSGGTSGGAIRFSGDVLTASNTDILATTQGSGAAGNISLSARTVDLTQGTIATSSTSGSSAAGNAGTINIQADQFLTGEGTLFSSAAANAAAGRVDMLSPSITLRAAQITTETGGDTVTATPAEIAIGDSATSQLDLVDTAILASTSGEIDAGSITLQATSITIDEGSDVSAATSAAGSAGNILIDTNLLTIDSATISATSTAATANAGTAGSITLNAPTGISISGAANPSLISSAATAAPAGVIDLVSQSVDITNSRLDTQSGGNQAGNPAVITLGQVDTQTVSLTNAAVIASSTGAVDAGSIIISADTVAVDGTQSGQGIEASASSTGQAGNIQINTDYLDLRDATVAARSSAAGNAGAIELNVVNQISADNSFLTSSADNAAAGSINFLSPSITLQRSQVTTEAGGITPAATPAAINLGDSSTAQISLQDTAIGASTSAQIDAGSITLQAATITIEQGSNISAATSAQGNAGNVLVDANALSVDSATINATSTALLADAGSAGAVELRAPAGLSITGDTSATLISSAATSAPAGIVDIVSRSIAITDSRIDTQSGGNQNGAAAAINIGQSDTQQISLNNSAVVASSAGLVDAGNISILADTVDVNGSLSGRGIEASASAMGNAGNIQVSTNELNLDTAVIAATSSAQGDAGTINLLVANQIVAADTLISSSAAAAAAGTVVLTGLTIDLMQSQVSTETGGADPDASPATISIGNLQTRELGISDTAVLATTSGQSDAGNILLTAEDLNISGTANGQGIEASSIANNSGTAGNIIIASNTLTLTDTALATNTQSDFVPISEQPVAAFGDTPGQIDINVASAVTVNNSVLAATTAGTQNAGGVNVLAASINIANGSNIGAQTTALGNAGAVTLAATEEISIVNSQLGSRSASSGAPVGAAGSLTVQANQIDLTNSQISTVTEAEASNVLGTINLLATGNVTLRDTDVAASTRAGARAGTINISGENLSLTNGSTILASTDALGNAGDIILVAQDTIAIDPETVVAAQSQGAGNAGSISFMSQGATTIEDANIASSSNGTAVGLAGSISIEAADLILDRASISTQTNSNAALDLDGPGEIRLASRAGIVIDGTTITTSTSAEADAGDLLLSAAGGDIALLNGALITASTTGVGDAGDIALEATGDITLPPGTEISARSSALGGAGSLRLNAEGNISVQEALLSTSSSALNGGTAGDIELNGANIAFTNATISTESASNAITDRGESDDDDVVDTTPEGIDLRPGTVMITSANNLVVAQDSQLSASVSGLDDGGNIIVNANDIQLVEGSTLETRASGEGNSGAIVLRISNDLRITSPGGATRREQQSGILTSSVQSTGGAINANIEGVLFMDTGLIESSVATADGTGGNLDLTTNGLFLVNSQILARADQGNGGAITIRRGSGGFGTGEVTQFDGLFLIDSRTLINADSRAGVSGEVSVDSPDADLASIVEVVDARIIEDPTLADDICNPRIEANQSSFIIEDQGGVAPAPDTYFSAGVLGRDAAESEPANEAPALARVNPKLVAIVIPGGCD